MISAVVVLAVVLLVVWRERSHDQFTSDREREWALERGALLTRIQHPEIVIPTLASEAESDEIIEGPEDPDSDEMDLVGTVQVNGNGR